MCDRLEGIVAAGDGPQVETGTATDWSTGVGGGAATDWFKFADSEASVTRPRSKRGIAINVIGLFRHSSFREWKIRNYIEVEYVLSIHE